MGDRPEYEWPQPVPERLLSTNPFERFVYRLGFSRCPDFRLHADWHRFRDDLRDDGKREGAR